MEIKSVCLTPKHIGNKITGGFKKATGKLKDKSTWKLDKKKIVIACSVLLIGAAVYLNYIFFLSDTPTGGSAGNDNAVSGNVNENATNVNSGSVSEQNYFAQAVVDRKRARDEALEVLQVVVDNKEALAETKDSAMTQMSQIAADIQVEANIESLIESKGFEECIAVINEGKCNIIVKSDGLLANQVAQIKEIVYEQASINPVDIKIIEKK